MAELHSIEGVEIFAVGTFNGDEYTEKDLDAMIEAFSKTSTRIRPALKLGHTEDQKLIQNDGLPAAGFINKLYRKGQKLVADFVDIPKKIFDLIQNKAYTRVSSEIYWGIDIGNGEVYDKLLSGVALLGSDIPAVSSLSEILSLYSLDYESIKSYAKTQTEFNIKEYSIEIPKTDKEINMQEKQEEKEIVVKKDYELEEKLKKYENELNELKTEKEKHEEELKEYRAKAEKLENEKKEVEVERYLDSLEAKELSSAGMRPFIKSLLGAEKKEYSFGEGEKEKKYNNKMEILEEALKLFSANTKVNFDDNSLDGEKDNKATLEKEIETYMTDHKVTYAQAYKSVMKNHKE